MQFELKDYEGCFSSMRKYPNLVNISQLNDTQGWIGITQLIHRLISSSNIKNIRTVSVSIQDSNGYLTESNYNISLNYLKIIYMGEEVTYK